MQNLKATVWLVLLLNCACAGRLKGDAPLIKAEQLRSDFSILRKSLEEVHPGLYWYESKASMDHYFDSTYALLTHDMSSTDFFKTLLPLIANIKCVHTNLSLPNSADQPFTFNRLLPFDFYCVNKKIYITHDLNGTNYAGNEVLAINGNKADEIIEKLFKSLPVDGFNISHKYYQLNAGALGEGYALYFDQPEIFDLSLYDVTTNKSFQVKALAKTPTELQSVQPKKADDINLRFDTASKISVLTINSFQLATETFKQQILGCFEKIAQQKASRLIIDIRQNGGGNNDNVPELFSYISAKPFLHLSHAEMNDGDFTQRQFFANAPVLDNLHGKPQPNGTRLMNYRYAGTSFKSPAQQFSFSGDVVVLISGHTSSAAAEFAAITRCAKRATFVGEETGGCYYGSTGGVYITLVLPASKLSVRIPVIRILTAVSNDSIHQPAGRGTIPDELVVPSVNDVINSRDVQLEKAFELLRKRLNK